MLISGGSGITPVLSMLRTLCDEGHDGEIAFLHYARTAADWLYRAEVEALAAAIATSASQYVATREGGGHVSAEAIADCCPTMPPGCAHAAVCGPPALIEAVREICADAPERVLAETFTPPTLTVTGDAAAGDAPLPAQRPHAAIGDGHAARAGRGRRA